MTTDFSFDQANEAKALKELSKYPDGNARSAVKSFLFLAQNQLGGWLTREAMDYIAARLDMAPIRVYEVASFYDMFNTKPTGRVQIRACTTTPCWLCGSDDVVKACKDTLGVEIGESTEDGRFFLREFECLGACANAPVLWIDDVFYEDLDYDTTTSLLKKVMNGETPPAGSAKGRTGSMPISGKTSLTDDSVTKGDN